MFKHTPLFLFLLTLTFFSPVIGTKESEDDSFRSAESCGDTLGHDISITLPPSEPLQTEVTSQPIGVEYT